MLEFISFIIVLGAVLGIISAFVVPIFNSRESNNDTTKEEDCEQKATISVPDSNDEVIVEQKQAEKERESNWKIIIPILEESDAITESENIESVSTIVDHLTKSDVANTSLDMTLQSPEVTSAEHKECQIINMTKQSDPFSSDYEDCVEIHKTENTDLFQIIQESLEVAQIEQKDCNNNIDMENTNIKQQSREMTCPENKIHIDDHRESIDEIQQVLEKSSEHESSIRLDDAQNHDEIQKVLKESSSKQENNISLGDIQNHDKSQKSLKELSMKEKDIIEMENVEIIEHLNNSTLLRFSPNNAKTKNKIRDVYNEIKHPSKKKSDSLPRNLQRQSTLIDKQKKKRWHSFKIRKVQAPVDKEILRRVENLEDSNFESTEAPHQEKTPSPARRIFKNVRNVLRMRKKTSKKNNSKYVELVEETMKSVNFKSGINNLVT